MDHLERVDRAKRAVDDVFSDVSVNPEDTKVSLEEIIEHIDFMLDTL